MGAKQQGLVTCLQNQLKGGPLSMLEYLASVASSVASRYMTQLTTSCKLHRARPQGNGGLVEV